MMKTLSGGDSSLPGDHLMGCVGWKGAGRTWQPAREHQVLWLRMMEPKAALHGWVYELGLRVWHSQPDAPLAVVCPQLHMCQKP